MDGETIQDIARWIYQNPLLAGSGLAAAVASIVSAVLSAFVKDAPEEAPWWRRAFTKVVNLLGFNWGKAANDPASNK